MTLNEEKETNTEEIQGENIPQEADLKAEAETDTKTEDTQASACVDENQNNEENSQDSDLNTEENQNKEDASQDFDSNSAEEIKSEEEEPAENVQKNVKKPFSAKAVRLVIFALCVAIFAFSGYKIIGELADNAAADNLADDIWNEVRGEEEDDGSDDVNVPADPVKQSGGTTIVIPPNNEAANSSGNVEPKEETENSSDSYDDRTYEQEEEEIAETVEEDTQYYVSRPSKDKDSVQTGLVIRPEEISLSEIKYLKSSNLKNLLSINSDTVGWIYFPGSKSEAKGTPIDTAIVQTTDNEFYLSHTFDKKENINGWVYADYRVNMQKITSNYNTILYGHARSYTMFGGLKDLNTAVEWYSNGYNHFIKINTLTDETVWQIFSWYETDIYYDYIRTYFATETEFIRFAYEVQAKNQMEGVFETFEFDENDRILTLSTCKGFDKAVRVAVHAKLVKRNPIG